MEILHAASAGTQNKEDLVVTIEPYPAGIEIEVKSTVGSLFADELKKSVAEELAKLNITACKVLVNDFSALDYVVRARTEAAAKRALGVA